jgi:hypothetical protein
VVLAVLKKAVQGMEAEAICCEGQKKQRKGMERKGLDRMEDVSIWLNSDGNCLAGRDTSVTRMESR